MSVYLACVGAPTNPTYTVASIERIWRRPGDSMVGHRSWTSGTIARQFAVDGFLESEHDHLFMLDADMQYPAHCLERLRDRELPIVSGLYMRRDATEIIPAAWEEPADVDAFPLAPLLEYPKDTLIRVGAVGHGYVLLRRDVVEAIRDFYAPWPMMIRAPMPEWSGRHDLHIGPDVRFFYAARKCGYRVWLDTGCHADHYILTKLSPEHFEEAKPHIDRPWKKRTALFRINRRYSMTGDQRVEKEELELLASQIEEHRVRVTEERKKLQAEAEAYAKRTTAALAKIDNVLAQLHGQKVLVSDLLRYMEGEVQIVRRGQEGDGE